MSSTPIDSYNIPNPASYSYPNDLPAGLLTPIGSSTSSTSTSPSSSSGSTGSGTSTSSTSTSPTGSGTSTTTTAPAVSPYVAAYESLEEYDTQELLNVSFSSPFQALSNVSDVLAQAATLQMQQEAAEQQYAQQLANTPTNVPDVSVPSLGVIESDSDQTANTAIQNYINAGSGANVLDFSA